MRERTISIPKETIAEMDALMERDGLPYEEQHRTFFSVTVDFGDGFEADIEVCSGPNNAFVNPVLFANGQEIGCVQDPSYHLAGEYAWAWKGQAFVVRIEAEEKA